jgi:histidinol dehydrogenase
VSGVLLRRLTPVEIFDGRRVAVDPETERLGAEIVARVRDHREVALLEYRTRFDGCPSAEPVTHERDALDGALAALDRGTRALLERTAGRIRGFAEAQLGSLRSLDTAVEGGRAGHTLVPVDRAGCYAPAGRFPLPSTLLMTVVTARVAGVREVIVATPRPSSVMFAAAAIAGADRVLAAGGAHAIGAMAWGVAVPPCDVIVGPGSRWVTAGKRAVAGHVAIDMLAGPSELLVVADETASPRIVAADLLAQAEHDADAIPALIATSETIVTKVEAELQKQLASLPTRETASAAFQNGFALVCAERAEIARIVDAIAPEHLQLCTADAVGLAGQIRNAGAVFIGEESAEVFGDYGVGGNHVLPTGRGARFTAGLSVLTFLRARTWLRVERSDDVIDDVAALARLEGLEGHARAALARIGTPA